MRETQDNWPPKFGWMEPTIMKMVISFGTEVSKVRPDQFIRKSEQTSFRGEEAIIVAA